MIPKAELDEMVREAMAAFRVDPNYIIEMVDAGRRIKEGAPAIKPRAATIESRRAALAGGLATQLPVTLIGGYNRAQYYSDEVLRSSPRRPSTSSTYS